MIDTDVVFQVGFGRNIKKVNMYVIDNKSAWKNIMQSLIQFDMQLTFYCTSVATMRTFVRFFSSMNSNVSFEVRIGFK